jgi:ATP-dependent Zn protease
MLEKKQDQAQRPRISWIWWLILGALLIWNLVNLLPQSQPEASITYSAFLMYVEGGNVATVDIRDTEIHGTFKGPLAIPAQDMTVRTRSRPPRPQAGPRSPQEPRPLSRASSPSFPPALGIRS